MCEMIVSASYRTDIPAFYTGWFLRRLEEGYCRVRNPYGGAPYRVALDSRSVSGFVFWTKNLAPFAPALDVLRRRGTPFVVQYSVNNYPRALEASVPDAAAAIAHIRALAATHGPRVPVWRYDPVVLTSLTPPGWHLANFTRLARALDGAVDEVVISIAQIYRKTARNMNAAAEKTAFSWRDPEPGEKRSLLVGLAEIAAAHGMTASLCSQPDLLVEGAGPARCIDADRLSDVAGRPVAARAKGNRPGCLCAESRDIGAYDTCPHGCVYCYAVSSRGRAQQRRATHDPAGEFLDAP